LGIAGQAAVGAGENAAYTWLGGGSEREVLLSAGEGALWEACLKGGLGLRALPRFSLVEHFSD